MDRSCDVEVSSVGTPESDASGGSTSRPPSTRALVDRREQIILAAEQLFAMYGYHAVSIRDIAEKAGVQFALVGYYYGPKKDLYYAIFERWSGLLKTRLENLSRIVSDTEKPLGPRQLRNIISAFVSPVLAMRRSSEGEWYAQLVARGIGGESEEGARVVSEFFDPLAKAYISAFQACYPKASLGRCAWAYQFALGSVVHHLTDERVARLSDFSEFPHHASAEPLLIDFIVSGVRTVLASGESS